MMMLLSHLNEQVLMQEMSVNAVTDCADKIMSGAETSNFELARQLETAKFKLINALIQFPITALWLLYKYEKDSDSPEQEMAIRLTSELIDSLTNVKEHCAIGDNENSNKKQLIIETLRTFAFSFEDLIELTDLIVYAFQIRGLCYQATNHQHQKNAGLITKRLKNLKRQDNSTLLDTLKALRVDPSNESWLFLSEEKMYQYVIDGVVAEYDWLNTRQQLVENNAKLVLFIAHQYKGGFLDFDDLVQEGQTGLLKAVDKFDYHLGFQFSTYAAYWIRQRISRALSRGERVVRIPCEQIGNIHKLFRAKDELLAKTGKESSVEDLAEYLKMSDDEVNTILAIAQTALPLESFDSDDEVVPAPIDLIEQQVFEPPFKQMAQSELESWLDLAIKTLNPRESTVVCCHFGLNKNSEMTLQEIGAQLNISRERVRQIQVMAFNKMKLNYGEQLVSFL